LAKKRKNTPQGVQESNGRQAKRITVLRGINPAWSG